MSLRTIGSSGLASAFFLFECFGELTVVLVFFSVVKSIRFKFSIGLILLPKNFNFLAESDFFRAVFACVNFG